MVKKRDSWNLQGTEPSSTVAKAEKDAQNVSKQREEIDKLLKEIDIARMTLERAEEAVKDTLPELAAVDAAEQQVTATRPR